MTNMIELQNQIDKLQRKVVEIKQRDFEKVVSEIVTNMRAYGITVSDLVKAKKAITKSVSVQARQKTVAKPKKVLPRGGEALAAKFTGPNGERWTGRGLTPRWLTALIAQGNKKEDFAVVAAPQPE